MGLNTGTTGLSYPNSGTGTVGIDVSFPLVLDLSIWWCWMMRSVYLYSKGDSTSSCWRDKHNPVTCHWHICNAHIFTFQNYMAKMISHKVSSKYVIRFSNAKSLLNSGTFCWSKSSEIWLDLFFSKQRLNKTHLFICLFVTIKYTQVHIIHQKSEACSGIKHASDIFLAVFEVLMLA